ncbi:hypothetical protein ABID39_001328 [Bartonella japonica]|uniref:Uncharacterized protein n=1 Tax=Bartonella japonica TaxID=357761 RepID=A0ABV2FPY2_9HYPH
MRESYVIRDSHSTYKTVNDHYKSMICNNMKLSQHKIIIEIFLLNQNEEHLKQNKHDKLKDTCIKRNNYNLLYKSIT